MWVGTFLGGFYERRMNTRRRMHEDEMDPRFLASLS